MKLGEALSTLLWPVFEKMAAKAPKKEKRRPWNVANHRTGRRPMSVSTMLRKEKDGTLQTKFGEAAEKLGFYNQAVAYTEGGTDGGSSKDPKKKTDNIPSRDDVDAQTPRREDGRNFAATEIAPGTTLSDIGANK